jgi:hypothetical protein
LLWEEHRYSGLGYRKFSRSFICSFRELGASLGTWSIGKTKGETPIKGEHRMIQEPLADKKQKDKMAMSQPEKMI